MVNTVSDIHKILQLKMVFEHYESSPEVSLYFPSHPKLFIKAKPMVFSLYLSSPERETMSIIQ